MRRGQHPLITQYDAATVEYAVLIECDQPRPRARIAGDAAHDSGVFRPRVTRRDVTRVFRVRASSQPVGVDDLIEFEIGTRPANFRFAFDQNPSVFARIQYCRSIGPVHADVRPAVSDHFVDVLYSIRPDDKNRNDFLRYKSVRSISILKYTRLPRLFSQLHSTRLFSPRFDRMVATHRIPFSFPIVM